MNEEQRSWELMLEQRWSQTAAHVENNVVKFAQLLRHLGLRVSTGEVVDALCALAFISLTDKETFFWTLKCFLLKEKEKEMLFDQAFAVFFATPEEKEENYFAGLRRKKEEEQRNQQIEKDFTFEREGEEAVQFALTDLQKQAYARLNKENQEKLTQYMDKIVQTHREGHFAQKVKFLNNVIRGTLSHWERQLRQEREAADISLELEYPNEAELDMMMENIEEKVRHSGQTLLYEDMKTIAEQDLDRVTVMIKKLAKRLASRISRRHEQTSKRAKLEIRRTIRRNISNGGVMMNLQYKAKKSEKPKVMLICDVSGSMSRYAAFVLQFIYGLSSVLQELESFIFADDLQHVTAAFKKQRPFEVTMFTLMQTSPYWGGGTNLYQALTTLLRNHQALLTVKNKMIIMSDAKTTKPEETAALLEEIAKKVDRLIWLNTLPEEEWGELPRLIAGQKNCKMFPCYTLHHLEQILKEQFFQ